jgi:hypothetical protein
VLFGGGLREFMVIGADKRQLQRSSSLFSESLVRMSSPVGSSLLIVIDLVDG